MSRRFPRPITVPCAVLLTVSAVGAQEPAPSPSAPGTSHVEQEPVREWLDEVRAQRQAREERRRAQKEAMDARLRWINPWGAAQKEARERETQRRRELFREQIERDRQAFRNQIPWQFELDPWQEGISHPPAPLPPPLGTDAPDVAGPTDPPASSYPLPGWDNRWYYRGF
jgi:hypothetical protein